MKIKPNYLYRVLGDLEKEGRVKKDGRQYYPAGTDLSYKRRTLRTPLTLRHGPGPGPQDTQREARLETRPGPFRTARPGRAG